MVLPIFLEYDTHYNIIVQYTSKYCDEVNIWHVTLLLLVQNDK